MFVPRRHKVCKGGPFSGSGADAERLRAFQESVGDLDLKLQRFANAIRWLGSSVGLLDATVHIQERLPQILDLFQDNASRLFDTGVAPYTPDVKVNPFKRYRRRSSLVGSVIRDSTISDPQTLHINQLPGKLKSLADALRMFVDRLNDVPEFVDKAVHTTHRPVNEAFQAFADDLTYCADCLSDFENKLSNIASVRHINELTDDLSSQVNHVSNALNGFIEEGVPAIRYFQERMADRLQNLSTTATFFSAISATTIQFRYGLHIFRSFDAGVLDDLLNVLWISLMYPTLTSDHQLRHHPRARGYVSFTRLVCAVVDLHLDYLHPVALPCGIRGRVLIRALRTEQPSVVIIAVTSFTVLTSIALCEPSMCWGMVCFGTMDISKVLPELGSHWLVNILDERMSLAKKLGSSMLAKAYEFTGRAFDHLRSRANAVFSAAARRNRPSTRSTHDEAGTEMDEEAQHSKAQNDANPIDLPTATVSRDDFDKGGYRRSGISWGQKSSSWSPGKDSEDQAQIPGQESILPDIQCSDIVVELLSRPGGLDLVGPRASTLRASQPMNRFSKQIMKIKEVRIKLVVPKLRTLRSAQSLSEHIAQVRHLRFSPNGQYLATCSWDRVTCIWKVGDGVPAAGKCEVMRQLVHTGNSEVVDIGRVAWSPNGERLLTKHRESIRIWNPLKDASCQRIIYRGPRYVQSVAWMSSSGSGFFSVEWQITPREEQDVRHTLTMQGSYLVRFDSKGNKIDSYCLDRFQVWDLAVMPDEERVVVVASLLKSRDDHKPANGRHQKRIIVYNFNTKEMEGQMPLMHDVRGIILGETSNLALVSYKGNAPPQTWYIDKIPGITIQEGGHECQIKLLQTYYPKNPVEFVGTSQFGAYKDTLVLAASKAGEIYIWERSSANLIHTLTMPSNQELTGLAWNPKPVGGRFMIASAIHNGTVDLCMY
ncbi:hypothetical protein RSAG8_04671, partial [Rhizoctonia solani AG-8 WAC10335]